jgi:class 3 adenylate cyclase
MIGMLAWCLAASVALGLIAFASTRRRRRMRRHPAPTFVFADLAGYTALTEERGDEAAAKLAREFRRTMCALSREHGATRSSRWAMA